MAVRLSGNFSTSTSRPTPKTKTSIAAFRFYTADPAETRMTLTEDIPTSLPADLSTNVLHSLRVSAPAGYCGVDYIYFRRRTRSRQRWLFGCAVGDAMGRSSDTFLGTGVRLGTFTSAHSILLLVLPRLSSSSGQRSYCLSRSLAARRELSRSEGKIYLAPGYELVSHDSRLRGFSAFPLPTGATFWYEKIDGLCWYGKTSGGQAGSYLVRLLSDPGPRPLDPPSDHYSTAI